MGKSAYFLLVEWLPLQDVIIFMRGNNLYLLKPNRGGRNTIRRLTHTGEPSVIFNGVTDWIYHEEVFYRSKAIWPSPTGQYLVFATINDTEVYDMNIPIYGNPSDSNYLYPVQLKYKYPKTNTNNPKATLHVIDLSDKSLRIASLAAPTKIVGTDNILFGVTWLDDRKLTATWTNRVQNHGAIVKYEMGEDESGKILLELRESKGWLVPKKFERYKDYVILLKPQDSGTSAGEFFHLTRFLYSNDKFSQETDLTPGPVTVHSLEKITDDGIAYYLGCKDTVPSQRNLYKVPLDGSSKPICVSCNILTPEGNKCSYVEVSFSKDGSLYTLSCLGPDLPFVSIRSSSNEKELIEWERSTEIRKALKEKLIPKMRTFFVEVNGYKANVRLILPADFDETKKYPMLLSVYAGPNTVRITDDLKFDFESYITSKRGVICAWVDGRGSAFRGHKMLFELYRHFGTVEVEDQIAVTKILQDRYSWIDANRTAVWGWSYGGYVSSMILAKDKDSIFKCGVAVAPVSSWTLYDSIYTERCMGLPTAEDNLKGYDESNLLSIAHNIRSKDYLLIHGTGDDNVHYQNSMMLAKTLEAHDVLFQQMTYPDENHDVKFLSKHLYHTIDKFLSNCLGYSY
ncbi:venom dipeptidyl peptidase 4-like isoform X2 [Prorops nasuta]